MKFGTPLSITGIGLASSLGSQVEIAAAAFRAGMSRAQIIPGLVAETHEGEEIPIHGHQARPVADGLEGFALWLHLAQVAWDDLIRFIAVEPARLKNAIPRLGLIFVLPNITADRFGWEDDHITEILAEHFAIPLLRRIGLTLPPERCCVMTGDHAGTTEAFQLADEGFSAGRWNYVAVLAIDSYLDPSSVDYLLAEDRLKSPGQPVGLMPGEAAACLLLESSAIPKFGINTDVHIAAIHRINFAVTVSDEMQEPTRLFAAEKAKNLIRVWEELYSDERPALETCDHYIDLTGEPWRAEAWGHFLAQAAVRWKLQANLRTWLPASSFGETGTASSLLSVCLAVRAFQRHYNKHPLAIIWSQDANGDTSLIQLEKAN